MGVRHEQSEATSHLIARRPRVPSLTALIQIAPPPVDRGGLADDRAITSSDLISTIRYAIIPPPSKEEVEQDDYGERNAEKPK